MTGTGSDVTALQRKFRVQVNTGTVAVPVWTTLFGMTDFKPNVTPTLQSDSDYEDGGWTGQTKTGLTAAPEIKVNRRRDPTDATNYDTAQEALRANAYAFGSNGVANVRWYDRDGGPEAYSGFFEVTWSDDGGDNVALQAVTITLSLKGGSGGLTAITNPAAVPVAAPTVSSVTPATGGAAGGTLVAIVGTHFVAVSGAAGVKFGATNATSYVVVDENHIAAVAPAHAAGTVDVTVTSATGTSATSSADSYVYV
jgi:hypothetical protein